jgi:beta-lactam-binding protein with PASTA domain
LAGQWNVLGSFTFTGTARVVIRSQNGCSACADAVKFGSAGSGKVFVPNCVNINQASAEALITEAGLLVGSVSTIHHATIIAGNVISTTPSGGTEVPFGAYVDLLVSDGPTPVFVSVPTCVGSTRAVAEAAIIAAGLTVGIVTEQYDNTVPAGIVVDEEPDAGTLVLPLTPVDLIVSLGPTPLSVTVPNVLGDAEAAAVEAVSAEGLVAMVTTAYSETVAIGLVISQDPVGGTSVFAGSTVDLVVSLGPPPTGQVAVPNVVNMSISNAEVEITSAGLFVGDVLYKYSPTIAPGNVIIQSHSAGSMLVAGSEVDLIVCQPAVIIDNGDFGTVPNGNWRVSSGPDPYGRESLYVSNDGTATYTWTFSPDMSGYYNVSMWWTAMASRSTSIPVEIEHFNDSSTVHINQRENGGQWNSLGSYYFETGYNYEIILKAVGGGASNCADAVRFTKENILRHKYTVDLPGGSQMMPLMGDIDSDGVQEIVLGAGFYIVAIDGETGQKEWTVSGGSNTAIELVDLNNDGIPEILHGTKDSTGLRLRALNGNGTMRWTSGYLPGDNPSLFPIIAHDIDGGGYPTIFFATQDYYPDYYTGNISDYNGALIKLNHNGVMLDSTWIHKPCWGGMALGDANFDGFFEVYLGDRREGYHNMPAKGLQAFDANTLAPIWQPPDIQHSSPLPILADVTGDSNLEVVATKITLAGPIVLNSETGATISDFSNMNLPTHGTPTVCDIDEDGNLEVIYSTSYPARAPRKFVVFDLVTGQIDFEASFDFWIAWPPNVGDVTGDGHLEIIAATGNQKDVVGEMNNGNYPILIYDKDFKLIDIVELDIQAGQLSPARVFDVDNDGYNEVVVPGFNNKLMVYDTNAVTPNPPPNTWVQMYSTYRQGVPEYVELPTAAGALSLKSARMEATSAPEIVDHHEVLPLEEEPDDFKVNMGYE